MIGKSKPFDSVTLTSLTKTRNKPSEWGGYSSKGRRVYVVARLRHLLVAVGEDVEETLRAVMRGKAIKVPHGHFNAEVSTDDMIDACGFHLDCVPKRTPTDRKHNGSR